MCEEKNVPCFFYGKQKERTNETKTDVFNSHFQDKTGLKRYSTIILKFCQSSTQNKNVFFLTCIIIVKNFLRVENNYCLTKFSDAPQMTDTMKSINKKK